MFVVSWWKLLLGRSDACDDELEAKLKIARSNAKVEHDGCVESTFEGGGFISTLGVGEGVTNFVLVNLLCVEGFSMFVG